MIAPALAALGPRPASPRGMRPPDEATPDEIGHGEAAAADVEPTEARVEGDRPDFETVLDEDGADPAPPDQATVPAVQVATTAVDPLLAIRPPVPPPAPEAATEAEIPTVPAVGIAAPASTTTGTDLPTSAVPTTPGPTAAVPTGETASIPGEPGTEAAAEFGVDRSLSAEAEPAPPARAAANTSAVVPLPSSDSRVAAPAADAGGAAGGLALAPAGNADWRLSAHAVSMAAPREMAAQAAIQPEALAAQITLAVGRAVDRQVDIRLDPPELGRVHIQLTPTEQGLQAVVMAERPETHDLLRRHAEALTKDLNAAGYDNVSLDFAAGGRDTARDGERRGPEQSFGFAGGQAVAAVAPMAGPARGAADGALDIRL